MIQGNHQVEGLDYNKTFAIVAKMTSMGCFLSITVAKEWELYQMDVNNAFLHRELEEKVYMKMPPSFSFNDCNKVCHLKRLLYGLHHAPRQWFAKLLPSCMSMAPFDPRQTTLCSFIARAMCLWHFRCT